MDETLPKIPVPDLSNTLNRYLSGLETVLPPTQLENTRKIVEEFGKPGGQGQRLQARLLEFAEKNNNWVTPLWLEDMYLKNPLPLPINSNPFFLLPKQHFRSTTDQLRFAAKAIFFTLKFKKKVERKELEPEVIRGQKQCMQTYKNFFNAYRRPGLTQDQLVISEGLENQHFIVACKNQFFTVPICNDNEKVLEATLYQQLRQIKLQVRASLEEGKTAPMIGILTTENRRVWAKLYNRLLKSSTNAESLSLIENCSFVLCLDDSTSPPPNYATIRRESITLDLAAMANHLLHGGEVENNTGNRWYDKFLQLVVSRDGVCGLVIEHSVSEGITVLKFSQDLLEYIEEEDKNYETEDLTNKDLQPKILNWELTDELEKAIEQASKTMVRSAENVDLYVLRFLEYGKEFIKSINCSPDAYIQLALQLTHYKVHREMVSTYESASLRRFKEGRVDNIRANTVQALDWVKTMCGEVQTTNEEKLKLFRAAIQKQVQVMNYTVSGEGPDNHLMALREMSRLEDQFKEPELFLDKSYQEYINFRLSTSQLPNEHGVLIGYGPVVPNGYGCCYVPCSYHLTFCITSFYSDETTSSDFFALSLEGSLLQLRELLLLEAN